MDINRSKFSFIILIILYGLNIYTRSIHLPDNPLLFDVLGYYLYLPFSFIYHDLGLQHKEVLDHLLTQYSLSSGFYQATISPTGQWVMKYSMGMAVFYSPGFFIAHLIALLTDYLPDGFSAPYRWALLINSTLFAFLGLFMLRKVLLRFFSDQITSIVLVLIFLGTNYFIFSTTSAEMPHNYLFTMYAIVLWLTIKWHDTYRVKYMIYLSIAISLMVLARPTELVALIIPLLWNVYNKESLKKKILLLKLYQKQIIIFISIMLLIGSFQLIYWKIYSGSFIYYSYINPGEGFEFLNPFLAEVLFSFRKGWLIYTPLMVFALWGFYFTYRSDKSIFLALTVFFIVNLYIVSSWSCWWYAASLGQRSLIQSYALMSLPLGYFIKQISQKSITIKVVVIIVLSLLVTLNIFQAWQMRNSILSPDRMTFEYYVKSFGQTKVDFIDKNSLLLIDRYKADTIRNVAKYKRKSLKVIDYEDFDPTNSRISKTISHNSQQSYLIDSSIDFYNIVKIPFNELTKCNHAWIRVTVYAYYNEEELISSCLLSTTFTHHGKSYQYKSIDLGDLKRKNRIQSDKWNRITFDYLTPEVRNPNDELVIHIWNQGRNRVFIDDVNIELFEPISQHTFTEFFHLNK